MISVIATIALGLVQERSAASIKLITAMEQKYHNALSLKGVVQTGVSSNGAIAELTTNISYIRPNLLSIIQRKHLTGEVRSIRSDGVKLAYNEPINASKGPGKTLYEPVRKPNYYMTIEDMYWIGTKSIPDPSAVLDLLISHPTNVRDWEKKLVTLYPPVKKTLNGEEVTLIQGAFSDNVGGKVTGRYELYLGADKLIRRYIEVDRVVKKQGTADDFDFTIASAYDVNVTIDPPLDKKEFPEIK